MKCYICSEKGVERDAIAVCIVCGMGVCREHLIREEMPVAEIFDWGIKREEIVYPKSCPRILCPYCYEALVVQKARK
jgi:hypothetical protein